MKKTKFFLVLSLFCFFVAGNQMKVFGGEDKMSNIIKLPLPRLSGKLSLEESLAKRRSKRSFTKESLNWEEIGQILWAAQGITDPRGFRTAPSAGALYPLEIYFLTPEGAFHYLSASHQAEKIGEKDLRKALALSALGQSAVSQAPLDIVITAVYQRVTGKYGQRGERYVHIEAGHCAQNIHLQAVSLGLDSVPIGAFSDEAVSKVLSLPENYRPLYIIPVGHGRD